MLIIQHLLRDTEESVRLISRAWLIAGIVGIPYSAKSDVVRRLKEDFPVTVPQSVEEMDEAILRILNTLCESSFIVDVGGYCAGFATTVGCL